MSQADIFPIETTILYTPVWYSEDARKEQILPLAPSGYMVTPGHGAARWTVTSLNTGEVVYSGIGPVEIKRVRC